MTYLQITPSVPAAYPAGPPTPAELDALAPLFDVLVRLRAAGLAGDLVWHMPHDLLRDAVVFAGLPVVRCSGRPGLSHVVDPPGDRPAAVAWQRPSWRDQAAEPVSKTTIEDTLEQAYTRLRDVPPSRTGRVIRTVGATSPPVADVLGWDDDGDDWPATLVVRYRDPEPSRVEIWTQTDLGDAVWTLIAHVDDASYALTWDVIR